MILSIQYRLGGRSSLLLAATLLIILLLSRYYGNKVMLRFVIGGEKYSFAYVLKWFWPCCAVLLFSVFLLALFLS